MIQATSGTSNLDVRPDAPSSPLKKKEPSAPTRLFSATTTRRTMSRLRNLATPRSSRASRRRPRRPRSRSRRRRKAPRRRRSERSRGAARRAESSAPSSQRSTYYQRSSAARRPRRSCWPRCPTHWPRPKSRRRTPRRPSSTRSAATEASCWVWRATRSRRSRSPWRRRRGPATSCRWRRRRRCPRQQSRPSNNVGIISRRL